MIKIYTVIRWIPGLIIRPYDPTKALILLIFLDGVSVRVNHAPRFVRLLIDSKSHQRPIDLLSRTSSAHLCPNQQRLLPTVQVQVFGQEFDYLGG